jgi:phage terminase large subunit
VKKGPDSVLHGIQWLRQQEIILSPVCRHLLEELRCYQWQQSPDGQTLPRPRDRDNHLIDAMRYALENDMEDRRAQTGSKKALGL